MLEQGFEQSFVNEEVCLGLDAPLLCPAITSIGGSKAALYDGTPWCCSRHLWLTRAISGYLALTRTKKVWDGSRCKGESVLCPMEIANGELQMPNGESGRLWSVKFFFIMWLWNWRAALQVFAGASNRLAELSVEGRIIITAFKTAVHLIRKPFHLGTVDVQRFAAELFQNWNTGGQMFRLERAGFIASWN